MPSKLPISGIELRAIKRFFPSSTVAVRQPCAPWHVGSKSQKQKGIQSNSLHTSNPSTSVLPAAYVTPPEKMGRSGYDTTNMKVAKNPRPAAASKNKPKSNTTDDNEKEKKPAQLQQQQQPPPEQQQGKPKFKLQAPQD